MDRIMSREELSPYWESEIFPEELVKGRYHRVDNEEFIDLMDGEGVVVYTLKAIRLDDKGPYMWVPWDSENNMIREDVRYYNRRFMRGGV
jgi:hypothetical protein